MKKFSVTLSHGRADTLDLYADSMIDVISIYENLSNADVRMIKEVVYENSSPVGVVSQFYRELKILTCNKDTNKSRFVTVRFAKPFVSKEMIISRCKELLEVHGKKVNHVCNIIKHGL